MSIDLNELIESVYVSPFAGGWFANLIKETIKGYGVNETIVVHSEIPVRK